MQRMHLKETFLSLAHYRYLHQVALPGQKGEKMRLLLDPTLDPFPEVTFSMC